MPPAEFVTNASPKLLCPLGDAKNGRRTEVKGEKRAGKQARFRWVKGKDQ